MADRPYDLVLHGASGFVGALTAAHLAAHAPPGVRVALSGRSRARLAAVRAGLPPAAHDWPLVETDSADPAALAASARVVATTVGPYARYGLPLVEACARAGTHYADLTGEVLFVRAAVDRTDTLARETGARLVHACGYDSVPSDLAVLLLHEAAAAEGGLRDVRLVATARGGFSGGTVDSIRGQLDAVRRDPAARRLARDPFALSPDRAAEPALAQPPDLGRPVRTADGRWGAPFVMAPFNTRVVRRSNALLGWAYGRDLRYSEVLGAGRGPLGLAAAGAVTAGLAAFVAATALPPTRAVLDRLSPAPGTGPDAAARARGWFRSTVDATTASGRRYRAEVAGRGDPGYAATAVMLGESALALALDRLPDRAGSLTPATALGTALVDRLRAAGHTYTVSSPAAGPHPAARP